MSQKKLDEVRTDKFFKVRDVILYGIIILLIAAMFLCTFLLTDKSLSDGIKITYNGADVFRYYYAEDEYDILSEENIEVSADVESELIVIFRTTDGGYNVVEIDKTMRSVSVTEANCSSHKDCVYTPALKDNSSVISCTPHKMMILPLQIQSSDDGLIT